MGKIIITSGFFNPLHIGHVNLFKEAKKLGDFLVVIVNNDEQVKHKGSVHFMPEAERLEIIKNIKSVDEVILAIDKNNGFIPESLEMLAKKHKGHELIFAKGGDRNINNLPELEKAICLKYNIKITSGVGGAKVQSSSWLLASKNKIES